MPDIDKPRLVKLLNLTDSSAEGEALGAIRAANASLRKARLSWEQVIDGGKVEVAAKPSAPKAEGGGPIGREGHEPTPGLPVDHKGAVRNGVRAIPFFMRVFLFPVWLTAEAYIEALDPLPQERWISKVVALLGPLVVAVLTGAAWLFLVRKFAEMIF